MKVVSKSRAWVLACLAVGNLAVSSPCSGLAVKDLKANQTYLNNLEWQGVDAHRADQFRKAVIDEAEVVQLVHQYRELTRGYQMRQSYRIAGFQEEIDHLNLLQAFSKKFLTDLAKRHLKAYMKQAAKKSKEIRTFQKVRQVVQQATTPSTNVQVSSAFKFGTKANLTELFANVWVKSDYVDGSIDFDAWNTLGLGTFDDLGVISSLDPFKTRESLKVSLSRNIPWVDVSAAVDFGYPSTVLSASLSRSLFVSNLHVNYAHSQPLETDRTGEDLLRLSYHLAF